MSDDKRTEVIEFRDPETSALCRVAVYYETIGGDYGGEPEVDERDATPADLEAAGYVKRELFEESERAHQSTWAKMMRQAENLTGLNASLQSTRQELIATREQLADVTAKLKEAELERDQFRDLLNTSRTKLLAAEGRVRELSGAAARFLKLLETGAPGIVDARCALLELLKTPAPEAAKPAERAPVEGCGCEGCVYCHDNHDAATHCLCRCEFEEPASPPSPAQAEPVLIGRCAYTTLGKRCVLPIGHAQQEHEFRRPVAECPHCDSPKHTFGCPNNPSMFKRPDSRPQPPAAPGTTLTVELQKRIYQNAYDRAKSRGAYKEAVVYGGLAEALADELERAQKGGEG